MISIACTEIVLYERLSLLLALIASFVIDKARQQAK